MEVRIDALFARLLGPCAVAITMTIVVSAAAQQSASPPANVPPPLFSAPLAEAPGHSLVVVELKYTPNAAPPSTLERHRRGHHHPGSVYVYVTQGAVRLGVEGQPVQVVRAGESFFEPVGAHHIINENASATDPARAIAVMIVPDGKPLVTPDEE
jgi:mannose-6-phosphate isomerase-like protein (cupin superfamily)